MRALIIIYEFPNSIINNRKTFEERIRQYKQYAFLTNNSCLIFTNATVVSVRDYLNFGLSNDDKLYVGETKAPSAWNNLHSEVSDYIKQNLK
jgi:hypothetical protein